MATDGMKPAEVSRPMEVINLALSHMRHDMTTILPATMKETVRETVMEAIRVALPEELQRKVRMLGYSHHRVYYLT